MQAKFRLQLNIVLSNHKDFKTRDMVLPIMWFETVSEFILTKMTQLTFNLQGIDQLPERFMHLLRLAANVPLYLRGGSLFFFFAFSAALLLINRKTIVEKIRCKFFFKSSSSTEVLENEMSARPNSAVMSEPTVNEGNFYIIYILKV